MENLIQKKKQYKIGYSYRVLRTETVILSKKTNKDKLNQYIKFVFFNDTDASYVLSTSSFPF